MLCAEVCAGDQATDLHRLRVSVTHLDHISSGIWHVEFDARRYRDAISLSLPCGSKWFNLCMKTVTRRCARERLPHTDRSIALTAIAQRITQLKHIAEILSPSGPVREGYKDDCQVGGGEERGGETEVPGLDQGRPVIDILVGDFNALTRSDYTGEQWQVRLISHSLSMLRCLSRLLFAYTEA